jgi:hypothetical protein
VIIDGVKLAIGFVDHVQILTTSNSSATVNWHTLKFTTAHTSLLQPAVFWPSRCLATASRAEFPLTLVSRKILVSQLPVSNSNGLERLKRSSFLSNKLTHSPTNLLLTSLNCSSQIVPLITYWHRTGNTVSHCCSSTFSVGTCLFAKSLASNNCRTFAYSVILA